MADEPLTPEGRAYRKALNAQMERMGRDLLHSFEAALWRDPSAPKPPCEHNNDRFDGEVWRCYVCGAKKTPADPEERRRKVEASSDPLQRYCPKHEHAYVSDGGGPGPFSLCPDCYEEDYERAKARGLLR